jgi:hypothetical protein
MPFIAPACALGDVFDVADCVPSVAERRLVQAFRLLRHPSCDLALFLPDFSDEMVRHASNSSLVRVHHS